ncbi:MAG: hypothetical protein B7Y47_03625 [Sphingomonas sp. 28-63-12]|nr:MAG: hypothetical protein B7Y47_03625 [Sphingomonas sp. 28-63-12]
MWRYLAAAIGAALLVAAGYSVMTGRAVSRSPLPSAPGAARAQIADLPNEAPEASAQTREQRRFGRYDKDKNGAITRAEYLAARQKAYARLDINQDGHLSFDEWAVKATTKFADADANKDGAMTPAEFATTAVVRKPKPKCACPAPAPTTDDDN